MNIVYMEKLAKQFSKATGENIKKMDKKQFSLWLFEYQGLLMELKKYYSYLGFDVEDTDSYEIGKGPIDSILEDKNRCISEYIEPKSEIFVADNDIKIASENGIKILNDFDFLYTFNPYGEVEEKTMMKLLKTGSCASINMCGKKNDKDKNKKVKKIMKFGDLLENTTINFEENRDNYFCTLYNNNCKKLVKTKDNVK